MRRALRGYHREDVDQFLDRCVATLGVEASRFPELRSRPTSSRRAHAPLTADDVAGVRFRIELRGYALQEVDDLLDRVAAELRRAPRHWQSVESTHPPGLVDRPAGLQQIGNVDHVVLLCDRLAETRGFYADVMGFPAEVDREGQVGFRVGPTLLSLRPRGQGLAWDDSPSAPGSVRAQVAFRVPAPASVDACHDQLIAKGVAVLTAPTDVPASGRRTLCFADPEGHVIEVYAQGPPAPR
jgi:DivIVA domain-containing protein